MPPTYPVELPDVNYFTRQVLCREGCPVRTDSGGYVQAIAEGRYEDAYIIARTPNPFASICGRVCAAPCEAKCRRGALDAAVSIRALKRFVCEKFGVESDDFDLGRVYPELRDPRRERIGGGRKVAIIGAGPAGLSCAHELALMGFRADGFRGAKRRRRHAGARRARIPAAARNHPGGNRGHRIARRGDSPEHAGWAGISLLADLKQQGYEAVFLGIGAHKSRELAIEGVQLDGVLRAIEFLLNVNLGFRVSLGRKVVVIGGGNVAFDVARSVVRQAEKFAGMSEAELRVALHQAASALEQLTAREPEAPDEVRLALDVAREAIRKGVPEVHMYCLENLDEIPAAREEIEEAEKEGIRLHTRFGPKRIVGRDGKVTGIELIKASRVFDENRRFNPQFIEGSEETVDCDTVVLAIGQSADLAWIQPEDNLKVTPRGTLQTDPATHGHLAARCVCGRRRGVRPAHHHHRGRRGQAGGEFHREIPHGPRARRAAPGARDDLQHAAVPDEAGLREVRPPSPPTLPLDRRIGIAEVEKDYPEAGRAAAGRSLPEMPRRPGVQRRRVHPLRRLRRCLPGILPAPGGCRQPARRRKTAGARSWRATGACPSRGEQGAIIKDETRCIRCGLCAVRCPTGAITMERVELVPA